MDLKKENRTRIQIFWQIIAIILLNAIVIAAIGFVYENTQTLSSIGSRGQEVRQIQTKLKELGLYKGSIDGIYGMSTQKAVRQFQKNCGITADGIAGPQTLKYLGLGGGSTSSTNGYSSNDIYLLARIIAAEARGESYTGQVAVGAVVLNRVRSSSFPNTIAGVIYQKGAFDVVADGQINMTPNSTAIKAARDAMNGWDPTYGAIYYYNPVTATSQWIFTRKTTVTIGNHVFAK
jgi:N-acetylmuramoyl-L-alanine amidase